MSVIRANSSHYQLSQEVNEVLFGYYFTVFVIILVRYFFYKRSLRHNMKFNRHLPDLHWPS